MRKLLMTAAVLGLLLLGPSAASAADTAPQSVIHVITVAWKPGTSPAQIQAALDGVKDLPSKFNGITRVWTKSIKVQGDKANAIVMEFANAAALKAYAGSDAQKEWYKVYMSIRQESTTFDITN